MEHLLNIIENYLQRSREDNGYAILLNGAWGQGKTFYFEQVLKKKIQTIKNNENNKSYKVLYVSLNGLSKTKEIADAVLNEKFYCMGGWGYWFGAKDNEVSQYKADRVFDTLFGYAGAAIGKLQDNYLQKKDNDFIKKFNALAEFGDYLLCFDDLERCAIPINEVLGFINTHFVERHKLKTIIIANEAEISQNDTYKKIKEKVIGRTITFEPDTEEIAKIMFEKSKLSAIWPKSLDIKTLLDYKKWNLRSLSLAFEYAKTLLELVGDFIESTNFLRNKFIENRIFLYSKSIESHKLSLNKNYKSTESRKLSLDEFIKKYSSLSIKPTKKHKFLHNKFIEMCKFLYNKFIEKDRSPSIEPTENHKGLHNKFIENRKFLYGKAIESRKLSLNKNRKYRKSTNFLRNKFIEMFISYIFEFVHYYQLPDYDRCYFLTENLTEQKFELTDKSAPTNADYEKFQCLCRQEIIEFIMNGYLYKEDFRKKFKQKMTEYEDNNNYGLIRIYLFDEGTDSEHLREGFERLKQFFQNNTTNFISLEEFIGLAKRILECTRSDWFPDEYISKNRDIISDFIKHSNLYFNNIPTEDWPYGTSEVQMPRNFCGSYNVPELVEKFQTEIAALITSEQKFEKSLFVEKFTELKTFLEHNPLQDSFGFDLRKRITHSQEVKLVQWVWHTIKNGYDWRDFIEICKNPKQQVKDKARILEVLKAALDKSDLDKLHKHRIKEALELVEKWPDL